MNAVVKELRPQPEKGLYLGPAHVNSVASQGVLATLSDGRIVHAEPAFALPYVPVVGDLLLVIGTGGKHYALGVLRGAGQTEIALHGDVQIRAISGKLSLSGAKGVEINGPRLDVYVGAFQTIARDVVQAFESVCQHVGGLLRVHARETQTLVDEAAYTQAKSAAVFADETVTINGREVHIG